MALSRAKMSKIAAQKRRELFYDGGYGKSEMDAARQAFLRTGDVAGIRVYLPGVAGCGPGAERSLRRSGSDRADLTRGRILS